MPDNDLLFPPEVSSADVRQAELIDLVAQFAPADGLHDTAIAPLQLLRASAATQRLPAVYEPGLCVVVQGRKQALLAGEVFRYDPLHYLVISVMLPIVAQILEATPEKPYLRVRLNIDPREIGALMLEAAVSESQVAGVERGLRVSRVSAPLLDAVPAAAAPVAGAPLRRDLIGGAAEPRLGRRPKERIVGGRPFGQHFWDAGLDRS